MDEETLELDFAIIIQRKLWLLRCPVSRAERRHCYVDSGHASKQPWRYAQSLRYSTITSQSYSSRKNASRNPQGNSDDFHMRVAAVLIGHVDSLGVWLCGYPIGSRAMKRVVNVGHFREVLLLDATRAYSDISDQG